MNECQDYVHFRLDNEISKRPGLKWLISAASAVSMDSHSLPSNSLVLLHLPSKEWLDSTPFRRLPGTPMACRWLVDMSQGFRGVSRGDVGWSVRQLWVPGCLAQIPSLVDVQLQLASCETPEADKLRSLAGQLTLPSWRPQPTKKTLGIRRQRVNLKGEIHFPVLDWPLRSKC